MNAVPARRSRLISTLSITVAIILLTILGLAILVRGGDAFSPGPVTAKQKAGVVLKRFHAHADFEMQCHWCHQPLRGELAVQCLTCHIRVEDQLKNQTGAHGRLVNPMACAACHAEHKGRAFDPLKTALENFDHNLTAFPLTGRHAESACADCHPAGQYDTVTPQCVTCHAEPKLHANLYGEDCAACHTSQGWRPASMRGLPYDHAMALFTLDHHTLDFNDTPLVCAACHTPGTNQISIQRCMDCHNTRDAAFMQEHIRQFGDSCLQCHDGRDRMQGFKHENYFPLSGKHAALDCASCHNGKKFNGTPSECAACHNEPEIHAGVMGVKCQYCHTADAWQPAFLQAHGFPLDHGGWGEQSCQTCHVDSYAQYNCYVCHDHAQESITESHVKAGIPVERIPGCADCHLDGQIHRDERQ